MSQTRSLVEMFVCRVKESGSNKALWRKQDGQFESLTWSALAQIVRRRAAGMVAAGVRPGDRVVLLSENRAEWIICDLAIQLAQGVHVPIHAPLTAVQVGQQINDCGASMIFVSDATQCAKLGEIADELPSDTKVFSFEASGEFRGTPVPSWTELDELANESDAERIERTAVEALQLTDAATILYTSGTTGEPKGVVLTHKNLVSNVEAIVEAIGLESDRRQLNFLPLSHIYARTCDIYAWFMTGGELGLAESRESVMEDCQLFQPSILNGVPYFYDRVRRGLCEKGVENKDGALQAAFGGKIQYCCVGGAALPDHLYDFYFDRGLPLLQGYGLTETSPGISLSSRHHHRRGAVGRAIGGVEVSIAEDGEILSRGPHIMRGYYNRPEATSEVIRDGWFHTGDLGRLDDDGYLYITGRKKEVIVLSGGKNVAPVLLESLLCEAPLILQAMVIGDDRNYLTALIVPDPDALQREIAAREIEIASPDEVLSHPEVLGLYEKLIEEQLSTVSYYEQVRRFTLLDRGFTIEAGELTPKLSLRREVIAKNRRELIEVMYKK